MKNNKSLLWGLAGLAVIILVGLYVYNQEQQRRLAEAETADRMTAAQQVEETKNPAAEQKAATKPQETAAATGNKPAEPAEATEKPAVTAAVTADEPAEAASAKDQPAQAQSADSGQDKPLETAALDTSAGTGDNAAVVQPDAKDAKTADLLPPQFDLLRVEPDGSTVVAGRAKPGGKLEVVAGDTVVAETKVGSNGDFAAVLDEPLPPGDHEIVLRVVEEGDVVSLSDEVATVSVPEDDPASLLVMVTRPGEASRILTQPEVAAAQAASGKPPAEPKPSETASATPSEPSKASDDRVAAVPAQKTEEPKADMTSDRSSTEMAQGKTDALASAKAGQTTDETTATASRDEPKQTAEVETPPADENQETAALADKVEDRPARESRVPTAVPGARLRIDAVEIESGKVFVAGSAAPPGATVRVYADGEAIGESRVSASGRFLVEAERDIPVGQHIFSADLMMPGSDASTMRVAVPFTRPRGETVAGVAAAPREEPVATDAAQQKSAATTSTGSDQPARRESASSGTGSTDQPAESKVAARALDPSGGQSGTSVERKEATVGASDSTTDEKDPPVVRGQPSAGGDDTTAPKSETAGATGDTFAAPDEKPADDRMAAKPAAGSDTDGSKKEADVRTAMAPKAETAPQSSAGVEEQGSADDAATASIAAADGSPEPPTVMQPALQARDGSVIIRRGDTLWQISRRVYGRGVRYTTIYLANTDQISNPDFIEPGQVFMVPEAPLANAEELHRQRLHKR